MAKRKSSYGGHGGLTLDHGEGVDVVQGQDRGGQVAQELLQEAHDVVDPQVVKLELALVEGALNLLSELLRDNQKQRPNPVIEGKKKKKGQRKL